jgi:hypothetical protein
MGAVGHADFAFPAHAILAGFLILSQEHAVSVG